MRHWLGCGAGPGWSGPAAQRRLPGAAVSSSRPLAARGCPARIPWWRLPDTGLIRATAGSWRLLADVGPPCPKELPAHAHADTLSCLVQVGRRSAPGGHRHLHLRGGTGPRLRAVHRGAQHRGDRRSRLNRSVGGVPGRPAGPGHDLATCTAHGGVLTIEAAHDGYRHLPGRPVHRRRWMLTEAGLRVEDYIGGRGRHTLVLRWHLARGAGLRLAGAGAVVTTPAGEFRVIVSATGPIKLAVETAQVALGLARTVAAPVLVCRVTAGLPVQISTSWQQVRGPRPASPAYAALSTTTPIGGTR